MFMTIPALALFYGGLVKRKNVLSILAQCFIVMAVISIQWVVFGYSLAFSHGRDWWTGLIGGIDWSFLKGVGMGISPYFVTQPTARIPHLVFAIFQMMFAVITPALIIGAFAERMKFSAFVVFTLLWSTFIYDPVAHWVWSSDGWLYKMGVLDFAGGTVVHITAGIASLASILVIGKRDNLKPVPPHNLTYTMIGAAMLWFGWFGFNAGSSLAADGTAASAFLATNTAGAAAALLWALLDRIFSGKSTMLGMATGAVAGLAAVTPGAGFVGVGGALVIGLVSTFICYFMVMFLKPKLGYDDSLDAFGVHGIGGIWGTLAVGLFATPAVQPAFKGLFYGNPKQLAIQALAVGTVLVYSFVGTFIIYKVIDRVMGVRVKKKEEAMGLDVTQHQEQAYTVIE
jgi:Amt family ammonium transporter